MHWGKIIKILEQSEICVQMFYLLSSVGELKAVSRVGAEPAGIQMQSAVTPANIAPPQG